MSDYVIPYKALQWLPISTGLKSKVLIIWLPWHFYAFHLWSPPCSLRSRYAGQCAVSWTCRTCSNLRIFARAVLIMLFTKIFAQLILSWFLTFMRQRGDTYHLKFSIHLTLIYFLHISYRHLTYYWIYMLFSALLRYNWHITLCKFKVYDIWFDTLILQN